VSRAEALIKNFQRSEFAVITGDQMQAGLISTVDVFLVTFAFNSVVHGMGIDTRMLESDVLNEDPSRRYMLFRWNEVIEGESSLDVIYDGSKEGLSSSPVNIKAWDLYAEHAVGEEISDRASRDIPPGTLAISDDWDRVLGTTDLSSCCGFTFTGERRGNRVRGVSHLWTEILLKVMILGQRWRNSGNY